MKTVFFGDSFTEGQGNNDTSFCDYVPGTTYNCGISGTTIGEYSIYPVDGGSLLSQIKAKSDIISKCDLVVLEYGINDATAVLCGFTTVQTVVMSLVKAVDAITQINPNAKIEFLILSFDGTVVYNYAERQCDYLKNDYFEGYDFNFPAKMWARIYNDIIEGIGIKCSLLPMIDNDDFLDCYISDDNIHPNNDGYKLIAENIKKYI